MTGAHHDRLPGWPTAAAAIRRYWVPLERGAALDDAGLLVDPAAAVGRYENREAATLAELDDVPVLVLLGEPGAGKSTELRALHTLLLARQAASSADDVTRLVDLSVFDSFADLHAAVLATPEIEAWRRGTHRLTLLFDSLDEALLASRPLAERLAAALAALGADAATRARLRVRVACRTAAWPAAAEAILRDAWGAGLRVCQLAPLRRADAIFAFQAAGVPDPQRALEQVLEQGGGMLAARPVTLNFLVEANRHATRLPGTQTALYEIGCRRLAEEPNRARAERRTDGRLTALERMAVASRLAALGVLGNRAGVRLGPAAHDEFAVAADLEVERDAVVGGEEPFGRSGDAPRGARVAVTREAVIEVLDTALFSVAPPARGAGAVPAGRRHVWAHRTFAEYLAARWLVANEFGPAQLERLFFTRVSGATRVVPQLGQTAAWVAGLDRDFRRVLLRADPAVLLRSDIAAVAPEDRELLVDALLALAREDALEHDVYLMAAEFAPLAHAGLARQLTPVIADAAAPRAARLLALRIAAAAAPVAAERGPRLGSVAPALVAAALDVALASGTPTRVRRAAVRVVARAGRPEDRTRLRPLVGLDASPALPAPPPLPHGARPEDDPDPDDELRGAVLDALWPGVLSVEECLACLTPRKDPDLIGSYAAFVLGIERAVREDEFDDDALAAALRWVRGTEGAAGASGGWVTRTRAGWPSLVREIVRAGWRRLGCEAPPPARLLAELAGVAASRLARRAPLVEDTRTGAEAAAVLRPALAEPARRLAVARELIPALASSLTDPGAGEPLRDTDGAHLRVLQEASALVRWQFVRPEDAASLLELLDQEDRASDPASHPALAPLLCEVLGRLAESDGEAFEVIYGATREPAGAASPRGPARAALARALDLRIAPVGLDSVEAGRARAEQAHVAAFEVEDRAHGERQAERSAAVTARVAESARAALAGDPSAWVQLNYWLSISEDGHYFETHDARMGTRARWLALDAGVRDALLPAARAYLETRDDERARWTLATEPRWPAIAGFRALRLLQECDAESFGAFGDDVWRRWAGVVVAFPLFGDDDQSAWYTALLARAYASAAREIAQAAGRVVLAEDRQHGTLFVLRRVASLLRGGARQAGRGPRDVDPLARTLLGLTQPPADAEGLTEGGLAAVLAILVEAGVADAEAVAARMVRAYAAPVAAGRDGATDGDAAVAASSSEPASARGDAGGDAAGDGGSEAALWSAAGLPPRRPETPAPATGVRERALAAGAALFRASAARARHPAVWPLLLADDDFARDLLLALADMPEALDRADVRELTDAELAELFRRTVALFPPAEDPEESGDAWSTPRARAARWRDSLLRRLTERGSREALDEVRRLRTDFPDWTGLAHLERTAELAVRRAAWAPPTPAELLALARNGSRRLIASERDLADVVVEALARFARDLRGVNATLAQYWDQLASDVWRPKPEETLSTALAAYLTRELGAAGTTTAREVRLRPALGGAAAEDVDLRIDASFAASDGSPRTATVLVEVKGQWFRDVKGALRRQLVERYLRENQESATGLYVVGWYLCDRWDPADARRAAARRNGETLDAFRRELETAAAALSTSSRDVRAVVLDLSLPD